MRRILSIILICFLIVVAASCSEQKVTKQPFIQKDEKTLPGIDIPLSNYNTAIKLIRYPGESMSIKNGDAPGLIIVNYSNDRIVFAKDFGVKIFGKRDEDWLFVENKMGYAEAEYLLETNKANPAGLTLDVLPLLPENKGPTLIRVVVVGHVEGKPSEKVGAFIDLPVNP